MWRRTAVILNGSSRSRRAEKQRKLLEDLFKVNGLRADVLFAEHGTDLGSIARSTVRGHYDLIVAAGGDGTMNEIAAALAGTEKTMGVLPLGTVNHFAKHLGVPLDLAGAVSCLASTEPTRIDLGMVNGRVFVNNSTIGVYARVVRYREILRKQRGLNKWVAFAWAAARMLKRPDPLELRMIADAQEIRAVTPFVFIGRSDYTLGDIPLCKDLRVKDGELGVCVARIARRTDIVKLASRILTGSSKASAHLDIYQAKNLLVATPSRRLRVAIDGEILLLRTPLHYRVAPGALRVVAPRLSAGKASALSTPSEQAGATRGPFKENRA